MSLETRGVVSLETLSRQLPACSAFSSHTYPRHFKFLVLNLKLTGYFDYKFNLKQVLQHHAKEKVLCSSQRPQNWNL